MSEQAQAQPGPDREVVRLVGANLPADQGLSSLGLLMQLGGGLSAAMVAFAGFVMLMSATRGAGTATLVILLLTILSMIRSLMHRAAGAELLYGPHPLRGIRRYVIVALAHSALVAGVLASSDFVPTRFALGSGLGLATWPLILAILIRMPRLRRFEEELPASEDKGFEGASILMTLLGSAGLGLGALLIKGFMSGPDPLRGLGALTLLTFVMLIARSLTHLSAGLTGLRDVPLDTAAERVSRYANFGIISALVASGVLLLHMMSSRADFAGMLMIAIVGWCLAIWPMALRRLFSERQFDSLLAGDAAPIHRRAPDAGLTALGWLLIALGGLGLSFAVAALVASQGSAADSYRSMELPISPFLMGTSWWSVGIAVLQLVAGLELIRMSPHHRIVATAVGGITAAIELWSVWPLWQQLSFADGSVPNGQLGLLGGALLPLVISVGTVVLVNRKIAPMARAVVRRPARDA